jgi:myo-inositol 2-dehydrogenase / D-chiro-inositol 1-dehydrogenase
MPQKIRVCIVGLGRAGCFHLHSIHSISSFELKYVVDPGLSADDEIVKANDFILLKDIEEALSDPMLDAVIVSPPTPFHYAYIIRALEAGKHVFAEKPLGKTIAQINHCFQLAEEKDLALHLGFQRRYDENFQALKSNIAGIAPIRTIKISSRDNPKPSLEYLRISGNIFHDMLIHDFDMLIYLLGLRIPESVYAIGHAYDPEITQIPDFDTVLVTLKYAEGLICAIDTSRTAVYGYDQRIELFAENGMAIAENQRNHHVQLHTAEGMQQAPIHYSFPQRYKEAYAKEIAYFGKSIVNHMLYNVRHEECILAHLIADAAHQSAVNRSIVNFKEIYQKIS